MINAFRGLSIRLAGWSEELRENGLRWFLHRVWLDAGELLFGAWKAKDTLVAFYDLAFSPAHFDFVNFLILAEIHRRRSGCRALHIVIVPGPHEGFDGHKPRERNDQGVENLRWRLRHVLVPCSWLMPSCRQVSVLGSRDQARLLAASFAGRIFPRRYSIHRRIKCHLSNRVMKAVPNESMPSLAATPQALFHVEQWMKRVVGGRKLIVLSLRECSYSRPRNSSKKDWAAFARGLDPAVYFPVIVRDVEAGLDPLSEDFEGITALHEIAWNMELRMALYEKAYLNLFVTNGPGILAYYNRKARYLVFKILNEECGITRGWSKKNFGTDLGQDWPTATPFQKFVWDEDRLEVIQEAFKEMCEKIESSNGAAAPFTPVASPAGGG
ncbi:MAG: hypothetical protein HYZ52_04285 [Candidatus Omnitrophica bacterium]|nr:hypothetical protein [Candidatus Omnitrophota bacterium]